MKNRFFGSYKLNEDELREFFSNSQIFFDTNTLLGLYRVKKDMAKKIIASIAKQKDRISIPYHVACEYHKHMVEQLAQRLTSAQEMSRLCSSPDKLMNKIFSPSFLNFLQKEETLKLKDIIQKFSNSVKPFLDEKEEEFNEEFKNMEVARILSEEVAGCIIDPLPDERIAQLKDEYKERAANSIPPGYKDKGKAKNESEGATNEAGDYIIWTEMMEWATKNKKDILLICNEEKPDWIWKECGFRIGPRRELCFEFKERTGGQRFHIIKLETFLFLTEDEYSEKEIKEIEEDISPVAKHQTKLESYFNIYSFDHAALIDRLDDISRRLKTDRYKLKGGISRVSLDTEINIPNQFHSIKETKQTSKSLDNPPDSLSKFSPES